MSVTQRMTAEDLWALPEVPGKQLEIVDGEVVEMPGAGAIHAVIAELVLRLLGACIRKQNLGLALPDNTAYVLRREPDLVRIPDVSFVSWSKVPTDGIPEGYWLLAPDVAVEIVSPGDTAQEVYRRVHDYLEAGTRMVWVLWPRHRSMTLYAQGGIIRELGPEDILDGGAILPGFNVPVKALFETPRRP